ncbi:MAG: fibronectin type III domain-containing protein, partial [Roseiflexaceae bacterium]
PIPSNVQIWVAAGTYKPSAGANRAASFRLVNGATLYGGFAGTESALEDRDWRTNPTILSGDIGIAGDMADNSYHVVASANASAATLLDGFTITAGNANGSWLEGKHAGGGMYNATSSPTIRNTVFIANSASSGGGMANVGTGTIYVTGSYPTVDHVLFLGNSAGSGGGMANAYGGSPTLVDVAFSGNHATTGGGIDNYWQSSPALINVTFSGNQATDWGGAMSNSAGSRPSVSNAIFWNNNRGLGGPFGQIFDSSGNSPATVSDSLLQAGLDANVEVGGIRNRIADPLFIDADGADNITGTLDDDLRIQSESPAIDAGNNESVPAWIATDLAGRPRFADHRNRPDSGIGVAPVVDIGAYEYQPPLPPTAAPSNLSALPLSRVAMSLSWADNSADEQGFKIERQLGGGAWAELVRLPAGTTAYIDSPLPCGTDYAYRVRAYNPGGDSSPSNVVQAATKPCIPQIIYVDQWATGANDGSSWTNAYTDLQSALVITTIRGDQIWVAAGTYQPSSAGDRSATFLLISGVAIYGGFGGGETDLSQRDLSAHTTILSGDLGNNDPPGLPTYASIESTMADNSYHVVISSDVDTATVLDGLTIAGGNAYGAPGTPSGGGMLNQGGSPLFRDIIFRNNAGTYGAGIANLGGTPT